MHLDGSIGFETSNTFHVFTRTRRHLIAGPQKAVMLTSQNLPEELCNKGNYQTKRSQI